MAAVTYQDGFPVFGPRPQLPQRGVPTLYAPHVHPYPTRYHGGIWTRPITAPLPYGVNPQSVFKPTDFIENNPGMVRMGIAGLGALQFQTHRGIFGEQRNGGGVFSPSALYGLGVDITPTFMPKTSTATATTEKSAAPALKSTDPRVKALQGYLNRVLSSAGYNSLTQDGRIGPATCGALAWYKASGRSIATGTTKARIEENLSYVGAHYTTACAAKKPWKSPTKKGTATVVAPPPTATTTIAEPMAYKPPGMSTRTKAALGVGAGALIAVGGYFLAKKRGLV